MNPSVINWSSIDQIRALLVTIISESATPESITPKLKTHLEQLEPSWEIKQNVHKLILSLKMANHLNLHQKPESEVRKTREFLLQIETQAHEAMSLSKENRRSIEKDFGNS